MDIYWMNERAVRFSSFVPDLFIFASSKFSLEAQTFFSLTFYLQSMTRMLESPSMASMWINSFSTSLALTFCWAPYFNLSYGGSTF